MHRVAGQVRGPVICLQESHDLRIDQAGRNDVARKLGADIFAGIVGVGPRGRRVVDGLIEKGVREVAGEFRVGGDHIPALGSLPIAPAFVSKKEKGAVPPVVQLGNHDRPADCASELVLAERRGRAPEFVPERIAGVKYFVPHELPGATVETVGSTARDQVNHPAKHAAKFCLIVVCLHLELLDGIHNDRDGIRVRVHVGIDDAVHHIKRRTVPLACDRGRRYRSRG